MLVSRLQVLPEGFSGLKRLGEESDFIAEADVGSPQVADLSLGVIERLGEIEDILGQFGVLGFLPGKLRCQRVHLGGQ